jgi:cytochrome c oxidase subunit 2
VSAAALLPALLGIASALSRAIFPQTATQPADAWMRAASHVLEQQAPFVVVAFVLVQGLLLVSALRLRTRPVPPTTPAAAKPASPLGLLWSLAPWLLVAMIALPALMAALRPPPPTTQAMRVIVIGHQWWWEFRYPELGVVTATEVHVPIGHPVRFSIESADVMHSLWLPAVGPRVDVPPLRRREFTFTPDRIGVYPGQCAELCGSSHAHMHLKLFVDSPVGFDAWLANQQAPRTEPTDAQYAGELWRGQQVFVTHACRGCHTVRGLTQGPGGPDLTHFASRTTLAGGMYARTDSALVHWILNANTLKQGSTMPGFPVPESEMKPLVAWLQSLL